MKTYLLRKYFAALILFAAFLMLSSNVSAQRIDQMSVTNFNGGFNEIVGVNGTYLGGNGSIYYPSDASNYCYNISLPFAFRYDGSTYPAGTTLYVHFGAVSFTNYNGYPYYYPMMNPSPVSGQAASAYPNAICAFNGLQIPGGVYYAVSGVAPNRKLIVEYYQSGAYPSRNYGTDSYQIILYETSFAIDFIYQTGNVNFLYSSVYSHGIGLNSSLSPAFEQLIININAQNTPTNNYHLAYPLPVELSTTPKTLNFGAVVAGGSVTLCTTVKHVGTGGQLTFNSAIISGSSDYAIVSAPAGPLNAGQSAQYCVQFTPSTSGARTATLTIVTNGQDSGTQAIALNGTGLYPAISVDSTTRFKKTRTPLGSSLTQWIHVTSTGQTSLFFTGFPFQPGIDNDQYSITHVPANPLPVGVTDSIGITYTPTREGLHTANFSIVSNASNSPSIPVTLRGTGILPHIVVTPSIVLFDSTKEGQQVCKDIAIWNPGSDTLKLSSNFLTSNDGDFHYTGLSGTDLNIPPDQTKTVTVCFVPIQQGFRQARLFLKTNIPKTFDTPRQDTAGTLTVDIRGTGVPFGVFANAVSGPPFLDSAIVGTKVCRIDTLKNTGDADIKVSDISSTNPDFSFSNLPAFPFLLRARGFITFNVCGTPDKQGLISDMATVTGTTSSSPISFTYPLGIFGQKPCITAVPPNLFTGVLLPNNGSDSIQCVGIVNCGDIAAVYQVALSGKAAADYLVTPSSSALTARGDTAFFCVTYKPTAVQVSTASLDVTSSDGTSVSVPLNGADGCAVVTSTTPEVPNTGVGDKGQTFTITVNNTGSYPLILGNGTITPAGKFKVISAVPDTIAPGASATVTLEFDPTELGNTSATLTFPGSGPCQDAPISVTLNGVGVVSSVKETASQGFSLSQSYPNPTTGLAAFTYTTPREAEVRIALLDLTGKTVRTLITGRVSQGQHLVNFDAQDLMSGTYIYLFQSGDTRLVRQFILAK